MSINIKEGYAEFDDNLRNPTSRGSGLKPLLDYFEREGYETNLK